MCCSQRCHINEEDSTEVSPSEIIQKIQANLNLTGLTGSDQLASLRAVDSPAKVM